MPGKKNRTVDEQIEESFPASDPPSFMGGEVLGAPRGRKTAAPKPRKSKKAVKLAPKKRKSTKQPAKRAKKRATKKKKSR